MNYIVGVDIGGTFTDCVVVNHQGEMAVGKSLSTPPDFSVGAADAVRDAARNIGLGGEAELLRQTALFFHACTIGENTLITRSGPRTGLVATRGFPDTLLMMQGKVTDGLTEAEAGRLAWLQKPEPFVPRSLVAEVNERVDYKGAVTVRLDEDQADHGPGRPGGARRGVRCRVPALVGGQRRPREGRGRDPEAAPSRRLRHPLERGGPVRRRIRAHRHHRLQRLHRAADLQLSGESRAGAPGQGTGQAADGHAVLRRRAGHRVHLPERRGDHRVGSGLGGGGDPLPGRDDRRGQHPGHGHGRHHVQGGRGAGGPDRAGLYAGGAAPPGAGAQDLGGVRGRRGRQHRLDRERDRPAQGGARGSRREPGAGLLRPRRRRAHGLRRRPHSRLSQPGLFPRRPDAARPGGRASGGESDGSPSPWE